MQSKLFSVKDKKILITGASSGIGRHFALALSKAGAYVIACSRREQLLTELVSEISDNGGKAKAFPLDVTEFKEVEKKIISLYNEINGIDVLINNAGSSPKIKKPIFEIPLKDWDEIMDINLKALWNLSNITAKDMAQRKIYGSIINISSTVANRSRAGSTIYGISKSAVSSLTQKLALEYSKYKIRVNAIGPGFFETDINRHFLQSETGINLITRTVPLERKGELEELEGVLFLLASQASSYITGECIFVDGGYVVNSVT